MLFDLIACFKTFRLEDNQIVKFTFVALGPPFLELFKRYFTVIVVIDSSHEFLDLIIAQRFAQSFGDFLQLSTVNEATVVKVELIEDALE